MRVPMSPSVLLMWLDFGPFSTLPMLCVGSPVIDVVSGRLHPGGGPQSGTGRFISKPSTSHHPCPASTSVAAVAPESSTPAVVCSRRSDLAFPCFAAPDFQTGHLQVRWIREYDTLASPSTLTLPSLCLNLDTLSSDGSAGPGDVSAHPICISDVSIQSGDLDQVLSGDDLPSSVYVDLVSPALPLVPARVQQFIPNYLPAAAPVILMAESSALISPNHVRSHLVLWMRDLCLRCPRTLRVFFLGRGILPCRLHR